MNIDQTTYSGPALREKAKTLDPLSNEVQPTADELLASVKTGAHAVGLAAPQIGISERMFVFRVPALDQNGKASIQIPWTIAINPQYQPLDKNKVLMSEGCFSVPHLYSTKVPRYPRIHYSYYTLAGTEISGEAEGLFAQIFQHETDHLNGILYIDLLQNSEDKELHGLILQQDLIRAQQQNKTTEKQQTE